MIKFTFKWGRKWFKSVFEFKSSQKERGEVEANFNLDWFVSENGYYLTQLS